MTYLNRIIPFAATVAAMVAGGLVASADDRILNSKHDLSVMGPGPIRATDESQVCIFCHTPHNSSPAAPLWNRTNPESYYRIYRSSTLDARVDQPSGSSKLCLSCHDGSIALGMVVSRPNPIDMTHAFMPTGASNLTNDLSDDHPIGFRFDRALANRDPQLRSPDAVDERIKLGPRGELDCIACHDPHNNEFGDFLRIPQQEGALCITCHSMTGWQTSAHAISQQTVPAILSPDGPLPFRSMADNACNACHTTHGAAEPERLLRQRSYDLCISCHDGFTATDISGVNGQRSGHRPNRFRDRHDPDENPRSMPFHVDCVDCHNPHATKGDPLGATALGTRTQGPLYKPTMEEVSGVSLSGIPVEEARFYYEVCFKCHSDQPVPNPRRIVRQRDDGGNIRRQFLPTAASAHPVTFASRIGAESPSLLPEYRARSHISCQDCHNNPDARQLGGSGPNGPHGSPFPFLLADRYETADFTAESPQSFALCYKCHDRNSILGDESFSFHRRHIVDERTPCSACHSPHGVAGDTTRHSHLINFDVSVVSGERLFIDRGQNAGSCTLTCHGVRHVNLGYGP